MLETVFLGHSPIHLWYRLLILFFLHHMVAVSTFPTDVFLKVRSALCFSLRERFKSLCSDSGKFKFYLVTCWVSRQQGTSENKVREASSGCKSTLESLMCFVHRSWHTYTSLAVYEKVISRYTAGVTFLSSSLRSSFFARNFISRK